MSIKIAGITGEVSIDANGDREMDYSLLDLNPEQSEDPKFEVCFLNFPRFSLKSIQRMTIPATRLMTKKLFKGNIFST